MLRVTLLLGWICLALDAAFVLMLLWWKDMGDDAGGRGVAAVYGVVLMPVVLLAGGVLYWAGRSGSTAAVIGGAALTGLPFLVLAGGAVRRRIERASRAAWRARAGKFRDPAQTEIARAIDRGDTARIRTLLAAGPRDYTQRDAHGQTLLGYAVSRVTGPDGDPQHVAAVALLLDCGVPYAADAMREGDDWFATLAAGRGDEHEDLVALALRAGADPNANAPNETHPLVLAPGMTAARLALLVRHGADVHARSARDDRPGWSTLMNAVYLEHWAAARFFVDHGVSPSYVARDGATVRTVLEQTLKLHRQSGGTLDAAHAEFRTALDAAARAERVAKDARR